MEKLFFWLVIFYQCPNFIDALSDIPLHSPHVHHRHQQHKIQHNSPTSGGTRSMNKQSKTLSYPIEVCRDRRYWKSLPNPDGVIGYGYNIMTGRLTNVPIFNTSFFDESECRLSGRRSPIGMWDMYRVPAYVSGYTFHDESINFNSKLRFRYNVYNSTPKALSDVRKGRSLAIEINESTKYDDLFVHLRSTPIRYYVGAKSYYEAIGDLALNSKNVHTEKSVSNHDSAAAPVLYSLRASATTGDFELKSNENLSWRHLHEKFRQRLRQAIVDDDFLEKGFFDDVGTHYATNGTFGGVSERWWISRRRPERKCGYGEESKILDSALMAACDRFRLAGLDEEGDTDGHGLDKGENTTNFTQSLSNRCHLVFDDERFRTSRWMVTSGGPVEILKAAHIHQAAFSGRSGDVYLQQWLTSLNDEPSTVRLNLAPICDLLSLVDERPWHMERCREQLLTYVKSKDPFYAGRNTKICSKLEIPLKFEKIGHGSVQQTPIEKLAPLKAVESKNHSDKLTNTHHVYCVPTGIYLPERTCRNPTSNNANRFINFWINLILGIIFLGLCL